MRFVTGYDKYVFEGRLFQDGRFKAAADFGFLNSDSIFNVFSLFRSNPDFTKFKAGIGLNYFTSARQTRLCVDNQGEFGLDQKTLVFAKGFRWFHNLAISFPSLSMLRYNAFIAYINKDFDVFFSQ
eukprot:TRINITY_DN19543_c0_g1_i2.p1 TRINITY_DN19543_c0_g1~~TRINITY_DN19543_c0_g1_i2.p1  ORF type:complete len:126 (+),score=17.98 TRINITY_DN19543_c0_g1_i2:357-734(+)